jgi:chaperonin GroES
VVSVGDGHVNSKGERVPLTVKEGDRVVFSSYAGDEITVGDETYLLMRESDILATL